MELPVLDGWPLVTRNLALKAVAFSLVPLSLSWRQVASVAVCGSASTVRFSRDPHRNRDKPIRLGLVGPPLLRAGATHRECPGDSGLGRGHEFGRLSFRVSIGIVLESQASRQVKPVKTSCWVGSPAHSFATCPSSERESRLRLKALID